MAPPTPGRASRPKRRLRDYSFEPVILSDFSRNVADGHKNVVYIRDLGTQSSFHHGGK